MDDYSFELARLNSRRAVAQRGHWIVPLGIAVLFWTFIESLGALTPAPQFATAEISLPSPSNLSSKNVIHPQPEPREVPEYSKEQFIGKWTFNDGIERITTNHPDGTATVHVTFDFITSFIYGSKLRLDTVWDLNGDVLTYTVVGGAPADGLKRLTDDFGHTMSYDILQWKPNELLLQERTSSKDKYRWKRSG